MAGVYAYRFCPLCGTLLDLPSEGPTASCPLCNHQRHLKDLEEVQVVTRSGPEDFMRRYGIEPLVPLAVDAAAKAGESGSAKERAKVNETCPNCGNKEMEYYTMQLRSADEGQTVFYECVVCKYKYSLNS